ncbi:hypothetical protein ACFL1X_06565 [Candidatus Hydrogenedentota bacterium]
MKWISIIVVISLTLGCAIMPAKQLTDMPAREPTDLKLWQSFREAIENGDMADPERYRPLRPEFLESSMGFFDQFGCVRRFKIESGAVKK